MPAGLLDGGQGQRLRQRRGGALDVLKANVRGGRGGQGSRKLALEAAHVAHTGAAHVDESAAGAWPPRRVEAVGPETTHTLDREIGKDERVRDAAQVVLPAIDAHAQLDSVTVGLADPGAR